MRHLCFSIFLMSTVIVTVSCKSTDPEQIKLGQYMIAGQRLFETHCANCHASDGSGLGTLIPPLTNDYIIQNKKQAICGIRNGWQGELVVDGTTYNGVMPANPKLTNLEIAEIVTYVTNSWGRQTVRTNPLQVQKALESCNK